MNALLNIKSLLIIEYVQLSSGTLLHYAVATDDVDLVKILVGMGEKSKISQIHSSKVEINGTFTLRYRTSLAGVCIMSDPSSTLQGTPLLLSHNLKKVNLNVSLYLYCYE